MSESVKQISQIRILESHICGLMVIFTFFGEHFKLFGLPLYIFPLVLCILLLLVDNNFRIHRPRGISLSRIETFPTMLILSSTITLPLSVQSVGTQPYFKTVVTALIMLVVAKNIYDEESFDRILKYTLIGIIVTAAACGYELITGHHFFAKVLTNEMLYRMGRDNSFGFQINVNDNASLTALSVFIVFLCLKNKGFIKRLFFIALALIMFTTTLAIGSRLVSLAFAAVLVEFILLLLISRYTKGTMPKIIIGTIFVILCVLYLASFSVTSFLNSFSSTAYYNQDLGRILFMQWSLRTITPLSLLFGHGCGVTQQMIGGSSIHSVIVELLCDNGIILAFCFIYPIIKIQLSFSDKINRASGIILSCFATAFFLISFCSSSMLRIRSIWVFLVIVWKYYKIKVFEVEETDSSVHRI